MKSKTSVGALLVLIILTSWPHPAGAAQAAGEKHVSGERPRADASPRAARQVLRGQLANGLSYYIERVAGAGEGVRLSLVVGAGDAEALPGEQQVAHVVEHVVVGNLRHVGAKGAIKERAERLGASWGSDAGAYTGLDRTAYSLRVAPDRLAAFPEALDIVREWADPDNMTDAGIARERGIVMEEARRNAPASRHRIEQQMRTWFAGHPKLDYARDPVGTLSARAATVRAFHARWYKPRHMAIVVVGDVDPAAVREAIATRFGDLPTGPVTARSTLLAPQPLTAGHFVPVTGGDQDEQGVQISFKYRAAQPGSAAQVRDMAVARLAEHLFMPAFANLVDAPDGPVRSGGVGGSIGRVAGVEIFSLEASLRPGASRAGLAELLRLVATVRQQGFSGPDIERARAAVLGDLGAGPPSLSTIAAGWETDFVDGAAEPGAAELRAVLAMLTPDEINGTLAHWLDPAHRDIFLAQPASVGGSAVSARELPEIEAAAARAAPAALSPPEIRSPDLDYSRGPVEPRGPDETRDGLMRWTLPSSRATLIFRPTDGADVRIVMRRAGGEARYPPSDRPAVSAAVSLAALSGLGGLDARELTRFLGAKELTVRPLVSEGREGIVAAGPVADWPALLALARAYLKAPQCDAEVFRQMARSRRESADANDPAAVATSIFYARIGAVLGRAVDRDKAALEGSDPEPLCRLYRAMLGDTAGMTIVVEGNLEPAAVYASVAGTLDIPRRSGDAASETALGDAQIASRPIETRGGRTVWRLSPRGTAAKVQLFLQTGVGTDARGAASGDDEAAAAIVGDIVAARLLQRLREVEGGTYSIGARATVADTPDRIILSGGFECEEARADALITAALDELARLRAGGPGAAEMEAARQRLARRVPTGEEIAERWIRYRTIAVAGAVEDAALRRWIAAYVDPSRFHAFILLPEAP